MKPATVRANVKRAKWTCQCAVPRLRGYPTVAVAGQVVVFCDKCAESRWMPVDVVSVVPRIEN